MRLFGTRNSLVVHSDGRFRACTGVVCEQFVSRARDIFTILETPGIIEQSISSLLLESYSAALGISFLT